MTTCPSGVHYMHLVDHARVHIEKHLSPAARRARAARHAGELMPYPRRFRLALWRRCSASRSRRSPRRSGLKRVAAMLRPGAVALAAASARAADLSGAWPRRRAAWRCSPAASTTCWRREINAAAIRVLTRHGIEVVVAEGAGCCGSLVHHMGRDDEALAQARANIDAWTAIEGARRHRHQRPRAAARRSRIMASCCAPIRPMPSARAASRAWPRTLPNISPTVPLKPAAASAPGLTVAYHSACSLQHGQRVTRQPKELLGQARLRGEGCAGRSSVLRLGRHLQHSAARHRKKVARAQSRDYREDCGLM